MIFLSYWSWSYLGNLFYDYYWNDIINSAFPFIGPHQLTYQEVVNVTPNT